MQPAGQPPAAFPVHLAVSCAAPTASSWTDLRSTHIQGRALSCAPPRLLPLAGIRSERLKEEKAAAGGKKTAKKARPLLLGCMLPLLQLLLALLPPLLLGSRCRCLA